MLYSEYLDFNEKMTQPKFLQKDIKTVSQKLNKIKHEKMKKENIFYDATCT